MKDRKAATVLKERLRTLTRRLSLLQIQQNRKEYFDHVNRLEALNLLTSTDIFTARTAFTALISLITNIRGTAAGKNNAARRYRCGGAAAIHVV